MKEKIKEYYKTGFCSSPADVSDEEIEFIITRDCKCEHCGKSLFEMDDFVEIIKDNNGACYELLCEECYTEEYMETCGLCEDYYEKPTKPENTFFVVSKIACEDVAMNTIKPGIYQAFRHGVGGSRKLLASTRISVPVLK